MGCILQEIKLEVHNNPFWCRTMSLCVWHGNLFPWNAAVLLSEKSTNCCEPPEKPIGISISPAICSHIGAYTMALHVAHHVTKNKCVWGNSRHNPGPSEAKPQGHPKSQESLKNLPVVILPFCVLELSYLVMPTLCLLHDAVSSIFFIYVHGNMEKHHSNTSFSLRQPYSWVDCKGQI